MLQRVGQSPIGSETTYFGIRRGIDNRGDAQPSPLIGVATLPQSKRLQDHFRCMATALEGTIKDGVDTVKLDKRSDDKKSCVWTGHAQTATAAGKATGYVGDLVCDGANLVIRAIGM